MAKVTADEFAEKWSRRLKGATEDIRKGVEKVSEAPSKKAIAKKEKLKARLIEAIDNGVWEKRLGKVTLEDWKNKFINKGLSRISAGVDGATPKMRDFAGVLLPHIENLQKQVEKMPDVTLEDSVRRAETFIRGMAKLNYKKK